MNMNKKIFAVSVIAILVTGAANADIASTKYVTDRVGDNTALETSAKIVVPAINELKGKLDTATSTANSAATKTELTNGLAQKQDANMRLTTQPTKEQMKSTDLYPSVKVAHAMILDENANLQAALEQEATDRTNADADLQEQIKANKGKIDTLNGDVNTDGSVAKQINTAVTNINNNLTGNYATKAELTTTNNNVKTVTDKVNNATTGLDSKLATTKYNTEVGTVTASNMGTTATTVVAAIKEVKGAATAAANAAAAKVATAQGADNKDKALITNASGNVTTGTIATGMITDKAVTKAKLETTVQTSLGKADAALPKKTYDSQVGTVTAGNMGTSATTVVTAIKEVKDDATAAAQAAANAASDATTKSAQALADAKSYTNTKTSDMQVKANISTAANVDTDKGGANKDSKYPSVAAAEKLAKDAANAVAGNVTTLTGRVSTLEGDNTTNKANISKNASDITTINNSAVMKSNIDSTKVGQIATNKTDIANIKTEQATQNTNIAAAKTAADNAQAAADAAQATANAAIPKPDPNTCSAAGGCTLIFNGTEYKWEAVGR